MKVASSAVLLGDSNHKSAAFLQRLGGKKLSWVGYGLVLVSFALSIDYFVNQSSIEFSTSDLLPELPKNSTTSPRLEIQVLDLYAKYDAPVKTATDKQENVSTSDDELMSLAEQNQQSGLLEKLFIGDAIYRLSGIVTSGQKKAALSISYITLPSVGDSNSNIGLSDNLAIKPLKTNLSLMKGDMLANYLVTDVGVNRVILQDNNRKLWLELFVPLLTKETKSEPME